MTNEEEIILEQYFPSINLDKEGRDFYLNLILNSKELTDSKYNFKETSTSSYEIVFMHLKNEGSIVRFDGAITNGEESKLINGAIIEKGNKHYVFSNVYRLFELVTGNDKEYKVTDEFKEKDGRITRRTIYESGEYFEADITLKTPEEMEEYYKGKIGKKLNR